MADDRNQLAPSQTIGHYKILSLLGRGGMGEVYLAEDATLGRNVALKLLPADFTNDINRVHRFQQEARAASKLNHPNIVTIHEVGQVDHRHFIAIEFIDGETLRYAPFPASASSVRRGPVRCRDHSQRASGPSRAALPPIVTSSCA